MAKIFTLKRVAITCFIILLIIITRFVYISFFVKVKTECARITKFSEFIDAKALIIRDEEVLKNNSGFLKVICPNNSKIAKNQVIAKSYESEELLNSDNEINLEKFEILKIEDINTKTNNIIRNMIHNKIYDYNISTFVRMHEKILNNKKKLIINQTDIEKDINFNEIKSETNGFFSSFTDGFENSLKLNITDDEIKNLNFESYSKPQKNSSNILGKIIKNNNCMILCYLDSKNNLIANKKKFKIKFELNNEEFDCDFLRLIEIGNNKKIAVFYTNINNFFANCRLENVKIKTQSYEGIKINKKVLHSQNGKTGVFILDRRTVKFRLVDVSYESGKFAICHIKDSDPDYLKENDLIIIHGHNLYDGKILRI